MIYGLYDTVEHVWMGGDEGPKTFEDFMLARIAAQMIDVQLGQEPGRTKAKEYDPSPKRLRDSVDTKMTALEALDGIEKGRLM